MERWKKLGNNVLLMTIGSVGSKLITFLLVPLYTAVLSTQDYGISDLIITTVNLLSPVLTLTISEAVLRFALEKTTDKRQVFSTGLVVWGVGVILLICISPIIKLIPSLEPYVMHFILYYISCTLYGLLVNFTMGIGKVSLYTITSILQTLILVTSNIVSLLVLKLGIEGYLFSFSISYFSAIIMLIFGGKIYQYWLSPIKLRKNNIVNMLKYSIPIIPNTISWWVSNSSDKYILSAICGVTITGIYSVAYKIPTILSVVFGIFMSAWRLSAVDEFGSEESKKFYASVYRRLEGGLVCAAAGIILMSRVLARILFANDFFEAWIFVPVLVIAFMLHGLGEFWGSIYTSAQKTSALFYSSFTGAVVNIFLNILLIPQYSGMGAAIATLLSYLIILLFRMLHSKSIIKFKINYGHSLLLLFIVFSMCIIQTINMQWSFVANVGLFFTILIIERRLVFEICREMILKFMKKKNTVVKEK